MRSTRARYRALNIAIQNVEDALERKLKLEKAVIQILFRYSRVNLREVVKALLEGELPIVGGQELDLRLATALGRALEDYDDDFARREDLTALAKKWTPQARKKAIKQKRVSIPR